MTPFRTLRLDHNNQALTKRFAYTYDLGITLAMLEA
jgi:hypothetical protein